MPAAPRLVIEPFVVVGPEAAESPVAVWPTNDGFRLHGYAARGHRWLTMPGLAAYRFAAQGPVIASPDGGSSAQIESAWLSSVLPLVVQARGTQVLHASAVRGAERTVALCGLSGAGKSTLAAAMHLRGHDLIADDALPFAARNGTTIVAPLPFALRLRAPASQLLDFEPKRYAAAPAGLLWAIVLIERDAPNVDLQRMTDVAAVVGALLPQLYCFDLERGKDELVSETFSLVRSTGVFRLDYPQRPGCIEPACAALETLLGA